METGIQSSFIPRDAGESKSSSPRLTGAGLSDFILLITIVLFVASASLAGGVLLYKQYLLTATQSKIDQLQRAKAAFDPALIQQLTRLDDRMHAGATILGGHVAPSVFFAALSQATLTTVAFSSLNYEGSDKQHIAIHMSGIAQSVNSIALQAQVFGKNGVIANPIFSSIGRQADGVHFNLAALVNPTAINYEQSIATQAAPQTQTPARSQPTSPFGGTSGQE